VIGVVLESLDDPLFYLGLAVVLLPLFVSFVVLRHRKLFFDIVCEATLLGAEGDGLQLVSEDNDDAVLMLFVIDLHNPIGSLARVGGVDIEPTQYQREILFGFEEEASVLEAEILESPEGIEAKVHIEGSQEEKVVLEDITLNQGDFIRLKAVVKNPKAEPDVLWVGGGVRYLVEVEGHIRNIKKIQRKWDSQKLLMYAFLAGLLGVVLDYSVVAWLRGLLTGDRAWLEGPPAFLLGVQVASVGLAAALLILVLLKEKRSREIARQLNPSYPIAERKPKMGWP
jgi:hypothetical protein